MITSPSLIAYNCPDEPSFKVYNVADIEAPVEVYSTTKAVAQIRPSKLGASDSFISFIEAKNDADTTPASYAYLKVVDSSGIKDLGISSTFLPNRSIYLGGTLIIKIKEAENSLQVYDLADSSAASVSISILSGELSYDYWTDDNGSTWVIAACQSSIQGNPDCHFYTAEGNNVSAKAYNSDTGTDTTCASSV